MMFRFEYTTGEPVDREFDTYEEASWFAIMEGDHLLDWYEI